MTTNAAKSGFIETQDGVRLKYTQTGPTSGRNVILIAGWCQTAAQWRKQVEHFQTDYLVTTYDHRGHGDSDKPSFGYRIYRLAADLNDLIIKLDLKELSLVGHSMGSSVIWAWWDLFPESRKRVDRLVLVDQIASMTANPAWTPETTKMLGPLFPPGVPYDIAKDLKTAYLGLFKTMFTPAISQEDLDWALEQSSKISTENAGTLFLDHAGMDWRDVLSRINVPTLVIGGKASICPWEGTEWNSKQIPGAKLEIFGADEGGSHFMFWENPEKFNRVVGEFLADRH